MLRKLNITLAIIAFVGALFCASVFAYNHFSDINNSKIIQSLGGE